MINLILDMGKASTTSKCCKKVSTGQAKVSGGCCGKKRFMPKKVWNLSIFIIFRYIIFIYIYNILKMVEPKSSCKSLCCGRGSAGPAGEESSDEEFDSCCPSQDRVQKCFL